ncbi:MAG TPA: class I SAM-dependent methyltransferase [Anditalea sp.]|nr:class I SAM-dependent methyltransferase [Anditalea sp.]
MHPFLQYIRYFFLKEDRHSLQSPFAYKIYNDLIWHKKNIHYPDIEKLRNKLLKDDSKLSVKDLGAGSQKLKTSSRKVKDVVKYSNSDKKFNLLYQYFLSITPANICLELGTGVGLNAAYLSQYTKGKLYTIEGDQGIFKLANSHLNNLENVYPISGNINNILPKLLEENPKIDFVLIDANHTYQATVDYFNMLISSVGEDSIIIVGDIYWSREMTKAWKEIYAHPSVTLSFDFYECGVLSFKPHLTKAHYIMNY